MITSYYIDENKTLHTFIGELKHLTFENVQTEEQAEEIINQINS